MKLNNIDRTSFSDRQINFYRIICHATIWAVCLVAISWSVGQNVLMSF